MLLMQLLEDLKVACDAVTTPPEVSCKVFKDNQSCIAITESKKLSTRANHVAIKHHYFRSLVDKGTIRIVHVDAKS